MTNHFHQPTCRWNILFHTTYREVIIRLLQRMLHVSTTQPWLHVLSPIKLWMKFPLKQRGTTSYTNMNLCSHSGIVPWVLRWLSSNWVSYHSSWGLFNQFFFLLQLWFYRSLFCHQLYRMSFLEELYTNVYSRQVSTTNMTKK